MHIPDVRGHARRGRAGAACSPASTSPAAAPVLARLLLTMCLFSLLCLVFVGLFPSVARLNFGIDVDSASYKWLYAMWGLGACLGALAVGTVLAHVDRRRLIVDGFVRFAVSLAGVRRSCGRSGRRSRSAFVLGFAYFITATSLITIFQQNMADTERASVMPLWFMAFGGTVPIGNLLFGPVIDAIGARWVLALGAVVARRPGVVVRPAPDAGRRTSCRRRRGRRRRRLMTPASSPTRRSSPAARLALTSTASPATTGPTAAGTPESSTGATP